MRVCMLVRMRACVWSAGQLAPSGRLDGWLALAVYSGLCVAVRKQSCCLMLSMELWVLCGPLFSITEERPQVTGETQLQFTGSRLG